MLAISKPSAVRFPEYSPRHSVHSPLRCSVIDIYFTARFMVVSKVFGFSTVMVGGVRSRTCQKVLVCTEPSRALIANNSCRYISFPYLHHSQLDRPEVMDLQMAPYTATHRSSSDISSANTVLFWRECEMAKKMSVRFIRILTPTNYLPLFSTVSRERSANRTGHDEPLDVNSYFKIIGAGNFSCSGPVDVHTFATEIVQLREG
jgi:hypothetical protein